MPVLDTGAQRIAYTLLGPPGAPVVMFSNSLGTTMDMWWQQAAVLSRTYRVLCYDTRGHGGSASVSDGQPAFTLDQLGGDVVRLLDALEIERVTFCGISMGGLTGLWLAVHAGSRLGRLVVANSAARIGSREGWNDRAQLVRSQGLGPVADGAAARWFSADFRARAPEVVATYLDELRRGSPGGYAACCDALADADLRADLGYIKVPTLLIAGMGDEVTTCDDAYFMRDRIRGALCVELDASHLSNIEAPAAFTRHLRGFLG